MVRSVASTVIVLTALASIACGSTPPDAKSATTAATQPTVATRVSATPAPEGTEAKIKWAMAGEHRAAENRARDQYRHPAETLAFFGLKDDMTVVELYPGRGGWYTEILAPVLRDRGHLWVTNWNLDNNKFAQAFDGKLKAAPAIYDKVEQRFIRPPQNVVLGPDGSADLVLTFRNIHNWVEEGDAESMFAGAFKVLKSGGTLGIVEHRAAPGTPLPQMIKTGYVTEEKVIELAKAAGFQFVEKSEINANPKDTKDHPNGVWSLPPALRGGEKDKAKFMAIGESDRMTIKLKKP